MPEPPVRAHINEKEEFFCCLGCKSVAELIAETGLKAFYDYRTGPSEKPNAETAAISADEWEAFDNPQMQEEFVVEDEDSCREATLLIEGIHCAACTWLIRNSLGQFEAIKNVEINPATARATVRWHNNKLPLSKILHQINRLGYKPHPGNTPESEAIRTREKRTAKLRLAVAGMGMMQVMTYAVALYLGAFEGMENEFRDFLRWISMIVAIPVVLYSGMPFFKGALRDINNRHAGMDVPIALALAIAFLASIWMTLTGGEEVYFDSVVMFIFFLLVARQVEMHIRHKSGSIADQLADMIPGHALKIVDGENISVPIKQLATGDTIRVRQGDTVPSDAILLEKENWVNESLLTGESVPVKKQPGDDIPAGASITGNSATLRITRTGADTTISIISRLLNKAQSKKPPLAQMADQIASWFILGILLLASITFMYWTQTEPDRALAITLSVLVATCPCALSLATPVSLAAATSALARAGVLLTDTRVLETLPKVDTVIFDKTGTLTEGQLELVETISHGTTTAERCREIAACMEADSNHPVAQAFREIPCKINDLEVNTQTGRGIEAIIGGQKYRLGSRRFISEWFDNIPALPATQQSKMAVCLAREDQYLAWFVFEDPLREDAAKLVEHFSKTGLDCVLASGDQAESVQNVATQLALPISHSGLLPGDKLQLLDQYHAKGKTVMMLGDGVNDAPVLAASDVSVAMGRGAALAQSTADILLLDNKLASLSWARQKAMATRKIIRQNLAWALLYNVAILPMAFTGHLEPWMAALGMSLSSLVVVLNALRLSKER